MNGAELNIFEMEVGKCQKTGARSSSSSSGGDSLRVLLLQCSDICQIQQDMLRSATKGQSELKEQNYLLRNECDGLLKQLEVYGEVSQLWWLL